MLRAFGCSATDVRLVVEVSVEAVDESVEQSVAAHRDHAAVQTGPDVDVAHARTRRHHVTRAQHRVVLGALSRQH